LVEERLLTLREQYELKLFANVEDRDDVFDVPLAWELRRDIYASLDELLRAVRQLEDRTASADAYN
jgi:hypothetical protein